MESLAMNFPHRRTFEGCFESICRSCYVRVAKAHSEAELRPFERAHVCDPLWVHKMSIYAEGAKKTCEPGKSAGETCSASTLSR
jgi:hypothetical protein